MTQELTVHRRFHIRAGRRSRRELRQGAATPPPADRVPRISRLMALTIRFETLVRSGEVADYTELARLGLVTRARMTQIMSLLNLAPDIQEQSLFLPGVARGREVVTERSLRPIAAELDWRVQRRIWAALQEKLTSDLLCS